MNVRSQAKFETLSPVWDEYELLDTGGRRKLERFGPVTLIRPEPQADWRPSLPQKSWDAADAMFIAAAQKGRQHGEWKFSHRPPPRWEMRRGPLVWWVGPTPAGHVGVFPDQASHWDWLAPLVSSAPQPVRVLCLFGHTGLATLTCAAAGAQVTHVDASRKAIAWARENQSLSKLTEHAIRWLVDDAATFVAREVRRGNTYEGFILDPPRFGRGPKGELWKADVALPALLRECRKLLSPSPRFVLLNTYTTVLTRSQTAQQAAQLGSLLQLMLSEYQANITFGELILVDASQRQISNSVFARAMIGATKPT